MSKKFLYFNDDILIGKDVWPEDFISPAYGQKVFIFNFFLFVGLLDIFEFVCTILKESKSFWNF